MQTTCPHCKQVYEVESQYLGRRIECQKCKQEFTIENSASPSVPPAPPAPPQAKPANAEETFKAPILSTIFNILGYVCLALFLLGFAGSVILIVQRNFVAAGTLLPAAGISLLNTLLMFGLSQVVRAISETAFNTRQLLKLQREKS